NQYAFSLLALLYPNLDYKNNNFHKDHLHPESSFDSLSQESKDQYGWYTYNSLRNLQMLDANENMSKNDKSLEAWVQSEIEKTGITKEQFLFSHHIPDTDLSLQNFDQFIELRSEILTSKLKDLLM
ncbi:DUF262 domain-containing protein, partial [Vibrio parahaemolyticus]|nr:DUF262 domain-containing protein [Vibrio parahaemolyticus]